MKFFVIGALLGASQAIRMTTPGDMYPAKAGIPDKTLMDKNPSHWKKSWPEGCTDAGEGDPEFKNIDEYNHPAVKEKDPGYIWPNWYEYEPHTLSMNDVNQGKFH